MLDEHGNLKISDFGLSSLYVGDADGEGTSRTELLHTTCGTPNYVAPEVLSDQGYDGKKADVWSCGVILYVLLAGFLPFDESTIVALFAKIQNADFTYPSWFSSDVRSLLDHMLVADPKNRINITNIKSHSWYKGQHPGEESHDSICVPTNPTLDQLESAVKSLSVSNKKEDQFNLEHQGDDDFDDFEVSQQGSGPTILNAFDAVIQCGGFMIDKMFSPELFYSVPTDDLHSSKSYSNLGGTLLFGSTATKNRIFQFTASNITAKDLTNTVYQSLEGMGYSFEGDKLTSIERGIIKANYLSAKGMLGMLVQIFILTPNLCLLSIRKGKGDILEWNNSYSELIDKRIGHLLNRNTSDGDAKDYY